jgi:hypothetical protein
MGTTGLPKAEELAAMAASDSPRDAKGNLKTTIELILDALGVTDKAQRRTLSGHHSRYHALVSLFSPCREKREPSGSLFYLSSSRKFS